MSVPDTHEIDWTQVYGALASDTRREVLQFLAQTTAGTADTESLAEHLCSEDDPRLVDTQLKRIEVQLHHVHLPKLDEAALIQWDPDEDVVGLTALGFQLPVGMVAPPSLARIGATPEKARE
jgi:hypothetical protein